MSDPRPPDPLVEQAIEKALDALGAPEGWMAFRREAILRDFADRVREPLEEKLSELRIGVETMRIQRDKAELQRSEALTQQETRLEFCRKELEELKAKVADCEAEHPPEKPYLEWCAAGKPDVSALREALEKFLEMYVAMVQSGDCGNWDPEKEPEVIAARAALSGASSPATSTKENE